MSDAKPQVVSSRDPAVDSLAARELSETTLYRFGFRSERLFLLIAVFIGVLSGLAVVWFRIAIEWCRLELLGSALTPSPVRMLLAPTLEALRTWLLRCFCHRTGKRGRETPTPLYRLRAALSRLWLAYPRSSAQTSTGNSG